MVKIIPFTHWYACFVIDLQFAISDSSNPLHALQLECEGDCDDDDECAGDLICSSRDANEAVPGCSGDKAEFSGKDFCVKAPQTP